MGAYWYVVLTKPKQEQRAAEHLEQQGGVVFSPSFSREVLVRGKLSRKIEPLFPGYLFLYADTESALLPKVRSTFGVRQLLSFGSDPIVVDPCLIMDLRKRCELNTCEPLFETNQIVILKSELFQNYEAIFKTYDGVERAIVLLNLLGKQAEMIVALTELSSTRCGKSGFCVDEA